MIRARSVGLTEEIHRTSVLTLDLASILTTVVDTVSTTYQTACGGDSNVLAQPAMSLAQSLEQDPVMNAIHERKQRR